jgi:hypothetical protein
MSTTRYNWLRDKNNVPVACILSEADPLKNMITFAVAAHNELDKFSKAEGRDIVKKKFDSGDTWSTTMLGNPRTNILKVIARRMKPSTRAIKAARYRLSVYNLNRKLASNMEQTLAKEVVWLQ